MRRRHRYRAAILGAALATVALPGSAPARAESGSDEARGARLQQSLQEGAKICSDLTASDYELIGEAWMSQVLGSARMHQSMNRQMVSMMGSSGEELMHEYMGRRASDCGGADPPAGFGRMMGMIGTMGGYAGGGGSPGMMGVQSGSSGGYSGSMMGGPQASSANDQDDDGPSAGAMAAMMAVLIGAVALALAVWRPWRHTSGPREMLDRRFAAGELSLDEYRRASKLLGGG